MFIGTTRYWRGARDIKFKKAVRTVSIFYIVFCHETGNPVGVSYFVFGTTSALHSAICQIDMVNIVLWLNQNGKYMYEWSRRFLRTF